MKRLISALIFSIFAVSAFGDTIYVDANGTGDYPTIQAAIDAATNGDVIILMPGTYTGSGNKNISYLGKVITVRSTNPYEQSVVDSTIIDCENSSRGFVFDSGEGRDSVLSGLTITNGFADAGGAVLCEQSSPTITKCTITNNATSGWTDGGGIYCQNSKAVIENSTISYNTTNGEGGGICCYGCDDIIIRYCDISNNSALYDGGGGICTILSYALITNCTITNNTTRYGGGIYNRGNGNNTTISNCVISGNSSDTSGGGITGGSGPITNCVITYNISEGEGGGLDSCNGPISNCIITNNSSILDGGGIYRCNGPITNCLIADNETNSNGGGIDVTACNNTISNCTITGNTAGGASGIYSWFGSNSVFLNCIVWGNSGYQIIISEHLAGPSKLTFSFCDIEGGTSSVEISLCPECTVTWGDGNIDLDPCFVDAANGNYQLKTGSACVNAGDPNYASDPCEKDLYGDLRILFDRIDMGCDEWPGGQPFVSILPVELYFDAELDGPDPVSQTIIVRNLGSAPLNWTAAVDANWLSIDANSGTCPGFNDSNIITVDANIADLPGGSYEANLIVSDPCSLNNTRTIPVYLEVIIYNIADFDKSFLVDFYDFAVFAPQWLQEPNVPSADIAPPEGDGFVEYDDLVVFSQNWLDGFVPDIPNLVSHWKLDGDANDTIGSNNGTLYGGTWARGKFDLALQCDGRGDYVNAGNNGSLNPSQITVSLWFNSNDNTRTIISKGISRSQEWLALDWEIFGTGSGIHWAGFGMPGAIWGTSTPYPSLGQWHHVVGTWDGTTNLDGVKFYLDGYLVDDTTSSDTELGTGNNLYIGGYSPTESYEFVGKIDDVRIYNRALTEQEIELLYSMGF